MECGLCCSVLRGNASGLAPRGTRVLGRVWYLETLACLRVQEYRRLRESVLKVCQMGKNQDWLWSERYRAGEGDTVKPDGPRGYCEYAAILVRTVVGNPSIFPESQDLDFTHQT